VPGGVLRIPPAGHLVFAESSPSAHKGFWCRSHLFTFCAYKSRRPLDGGTFDWRLRSFGLTLLLSVQELAALRLLMQRKDGPAAATASSTPGEWSRTAASIARPQHIEGGRSLPQLSYGRTLSSAKA
jgi:hypothetical protein